MTTTTPPRDMTYDGLRAIPTQLDAAAFQRLVDVAGGAWSPESLITSYDEISLSSRENTISVES